MNSCLTSTTTARASIILSSYSYTVYIVVEELIARENYTTEPNKTDYDQAMTYAKFWLEWIEDHIEAV